MNRRLELLGIVLALEAGVVGGITSSLADEAANRGGHRRVARRNSVALCASRVP